MLDVHSSRSNSDTPGAYAFATDMAPSQLRATPPGLKFDPEGMLSLCPVSHWRLHTHGCPLGANG